MIGYVVAFYVGAFVGFFVAALCRAGKSEP